MFQNEEVNRKLVNDGRIIKPDDCLFDHKYVTFYYYNTIVSQRMTQIGC